MWSLVLSGLACEGLVWCVAAADGGMRGEWDERRVGWSLLILRSIWVFLR